MWLIEVFGVELRRVLCRFLLNSIVLRLPDSVLKSTIGPSDSSVSLSSWESKYSGREMLQAGELRLKL